MDNVSEKSVCTEKGSRTWLFCGWGLAVAVGLAPVTTWAGLPESGK